MLDFQGITGLLIVVLNSVSAVGALLVVVAIVGGMVLDKKTMDRVSIRFTLAISVMDFVKALTLIFSPSRGMRVTNCVVMESLVQWVTLFYLFLHVAIATNLHLVFIKGLAFNPLWERAYWVVAVALATALSATPIGLMLGGEVIVTSCIRQKVTLAQYLWQWALFHCWVLATCAYCAVVFVMIIAKLNENERSLSHALGMSPVAGKTDQWRSMRYNTTIKALIRRVALYSVIPVVTQMGYFVFTVAEFHVGKPSKSLFVISILTISLPGTLNFLAFLGDPAFAKARAAFKPYRDAVWRYTRNLDATPSSCHTQEMFHFDAKQARPAITPPDPSFDIIEIPHEPSHGPSHGPSLPTEKCPSWISERPTSLALESQGGDFPTLLAHGLREHRVSSYMKFL